MMMKPQLPKTIATLCLLLFFVFVGNLCATAGTLRTVALSGTHAPGTPAGVNFSNFNFSRFIITPVLNNAGQTAFSGSLTGPGVDSTNERGIWSEGGGSGLALVARSGNQAPGTPEGVHFRSLSTPALNNAGQTAFWGGLTGTGDSTNDRGIWSEGGGSGLALIAREGNAAPGTPEGVHFRFSSRSRIDLNPPLNNAGQTAFWGFLTGTGVDGTNDRGIWSEGGGSGLALVAREGNAAPGTPEGVHFGFSSRESHRINPSLNIAGQTAFWGFLTGPGVDSTNNSGLWSEGGGSGLALVAREGNQAPGTPEGVHFGFNGMTPALNNAGQTAFWGFLTGNEVDGTNNTGIWLEGGGSGLALVARKGNQAPGTPEGVHFSSLSTIPVLNNAGQTAFSGSLTGTGVDGLNFGLWSEGGGSGLALVARSGNQAPGTPEGVHFRSFSTPALNNAGQTAFSGSLTGTGVDGTKDVGIWAEDPLGVLTLIAREGDLLDIDDGPTTDFRTISHLRFVSGSRNKNGGSSGFNDLGQLAFLATFTDGTGGVFVSNLVAVPEPTAWALVVVGLLGVSATRRR